MSDHIARTIEGWRRELGDRRARIEAQLAALADAEAALARFAELASADPYAARAEAARTGDEAPRGCRSTR